MAKPVSIRDVARRAGVSVGTVSNALNRPELVAPETLERVRSSIEALGFVRNGSARQLRAGQSRTVGLVVLDITNPFFTDVARGVEDAASDAGLSVILCNSDGDPDKEARYLDVLAEERVQGILIVPASADGGRRLQALRERGIAVVLLDRRATQASHCSVSVDDVAGGRLAVRHLLELGHRRIAFVGSGAVRQVKDRLRGATEAVVRAGCPRDQLIVVPVPALNVQGGRAAAAALAAIPASLRPTAAFCVNDLVALGLIQGATRLGLAVPGELSVVGYDDIDFAESAAVPLSSVRQPRQELGRAAAELLAEEVSGGPHEHRRVVLQPELVVRASTAPLLGAAPGDTAKRARHQSEPGATLEGASAPCA